MAVDAAAPPCRCSRAITPGSCVEYQVLGVFSSFMRSYQASTQGLTVTTSLGSYGLQSTAHSGTTSCYNMLLLLHWKLEEHNQLCGPRLDALGFQFTMELMIPHTPTSITSITSSIRILQIGYLDTLPSGPDPHDQLNHHDQHHLDLKPFASEQFLSMALRCNVMAG